MNMQDNLNNKPDIFSQVIRQKIENHTLPVDDMAWDAIQAGLKAKKSKRFIPLWGWYSGGIAAGILVLLFVLSPFNKPLNEKQLAENKALETTVVQKEKTNPIQKIEPTELKEKATFKTQNKTFSNKQITKNKTQIIVVESETFDKESTFNNKTTNDIISHEITMEEPTKEQPAEIQKQNINENYLALGDSIIPEWEDPLKLSDEKGWGLLASVGSSNGTSTNQINTMSTVTQKSGIVRAPTVNTTILTQADFPDKSYNAPLSAGLKINKKLSKIISIESGLTYTYLQTNFKRKNATATLNLHYLGIPVAAQVTVWNSKKFGIYASAGAMLEKGIRSFYEQNVYIGNQITTTTADTNIDGLQWSLNSSLGAKYSIFRDIDFYFEPKYSYYFDNNQPISIRTVKRHVISIEAGLKLNL